jgi:hypothetical protein
MVRFDFDVVSDPLPPKAIPPQPAPARNESRRRPEGAGEAPAPAAGEDAPERQGSA